MKKYPPSENINLEGLSDISKQAIRSNMLEGISPDPELLKDLRELESGTISRLKERGLNRILGTTHAGKKT